MTAESMPMGPLLSTAFTRLKGHSDTPQLDARLLMAHCLQADVNRLPLMMDQPLSKQVETEFLALVERRANHEPVAYLIGKQDFWSLSLAVSPHTLIPRGDTETVVDAVLKRRGQVDLSLLDMGTGSGAIALALLSERPGWRAVASDISADALSIAQANAKTHGLYSRVGFRIGSWYDALEPADGPFDIIVSNPPYIRADVIKTLALDVKDFEPINALDGGADGLDAYRIILKSVRRFLKPGGLLALEIGYDQAGQVSALVGREFHKVDVLPDMAGQPRCVIGQGLIQ